MKLGSNKKREGDADFFVGRVLTRVFLLVCGVSLSPLFESDRNNQRNRRFSATWISLRIEESAKGKTDELELLTH